MAIEFLLNPSLHFPDKRHRKQHDKCKMCFTLETPQWRSGPDGPSTLCNKCGLYYKRQTRKKIQN
ncbi:hypothetical protein KAFR_0I01960 [Kazachstania africana CBS 2517]|uniref:GATA-type domain-containing protein n=1 Tax=Kazachstania africana (strain ATCC 22294 / BCRC 22015 / CBS 2517 / CECT 1963 / NBRC 1671 / NRRL Y-8276) TaxID=1071382 RepID=H2B026_KAZAF|nr:hypothetical protein KAFR_0I01960 [Kazachstania africana CBS 2517]CCF59976.1 hypothetical protein KAFR_0I01960 [Kazachstania africana CBS 2517]